ncbi:O-antigen ligase family protein [Roseibium sediminis]|uniref:O-antigen ligase family protein n=1 Tax=Roseibium sediminis TaxID=1775174 RepID=UPI00137569E7|nr:O-antigen ligase family protein [Roseibium sediminis]
MLAIAAVGIRGGIQRDRSTAVFPCILLLVTAVLILIELRFGSPVRSALGGTSEAFRMNRGAVALVLFLPLALYFLPATTPARGFSILTVGVAGIAVFLSESESAKLSFGVLSIAYLLARVLGRYAIAVFGFGVLATLLLTPRLALNLNNLIPDFLSENISYGTLGIRADMWGEFSKLIWFKPILGHGMEASHVARDTYGHLLANDRVLGFGHAHNFAVQVWYELGLVGVLLFSALIILFFRSLKSLPVRAVPPVLATVSAIWTVSLVSHGAWQAWWWSLMGIIALLWLMVLHSEREAVPVQS